MALPATSSIPQVIGECVFVRHIGVEDAGKFRPFGGKFRERERAPRLESDKEDALTVVRHDRNLKSEIASRAGPAKNRDMPRRSRQNVGGCGPGRFVL